VNIGIAGYGIVGTALHRFFRRQASNRFAIYDTGIPQHAGDAAVERLNRCDIVFVAVPTPYDQAGETCDISAVRAVIEHVRVPACIKSTVPPGTTDGLIAATGRAIAFSPEYLGERAGHPWPEVDSAAFVICGGAPAACDAVRAAYAGAAAVPLRFVETSAAAAEIAKYMENSFLAMKVAFANQFFDLAQSAGVDYEEVRQLFVLDERVGESHTAVHEERGFGGRCLPKDLSSILAWARGRADATLLAAVMDYNERLRARARRDAAAHQVPA
jgi:UDPglucose 6-dehydrogenase